MFWLISAQISRESKAVSTTCQYEADKPERTCQRQLFRGWCDVSHVTAQVGSRTLVALIDKLNRAGG